MRSGSLNHWPLPHERTEIDEPVRSSKELELAWAAGLFEGEGSIYPENENGRIRIRYSLATTDLDVLERFQRAVGCGSISGPYRGTRSTKPIHSWKARKPAEIDLLKALLSPYFGERRRAQLAECEEKFRTQRQALPLGRPPHSTIVARDQMRFA